MNLQEKRIRLELRRNFNRYVPKNDIFYINSIQAIRM